MATAEIPCDVVARIQTKLNNIRFQSRFPKGLTDCTGDAVKRCALMHTDVGGHAEVLR